jgi:hypothetical protein
MADKTWNVIGVDRVARKVVVYACENKPQQRQMLAALLGSGWQALASEAKVTIEDTIARLREEWAEAPIEIGDAADVLEIAARPTLQSLTKELTAFSTWFEFAEAMHAGYVPTFMLTPGKSQATLAKNDKVRDLARRVAELGFKVHKPAGPMPW